MENLNTQNDHKLPVQTILPEMRQVENLLEQVVGSATGSISSICNHLLQSGGKRMRPLLVILSAKTLDEGDQKSLIAAGASVELIHMASLVHDDVIDRSDFRRGQPSVHTLWGEKAAVLTGDFLFAKAFDLLISYRLHTVLQLMVKVIQSMCTGEINQLHQTFDINQQQTDYFNRIEKKTAKLLAACCQSGAIITGAPRHQVIALDVFGTNLGYTFQITDDILDFTGHKDIMGKPVCQDLRQGNLTLPVLFLIEHLEHGPWTKEIISQQKLDKVNIETMLSLLHQTESLKNSFQVAKDCAQAAKKALGELPQSLYREMMDQLVDKALDRRF